MLNSNYSSNPYDTTRPKLFFGDRKKLFTAEITRGSGGKSYNPSWNANRKPILNYKAKSSGSNSSLLMISSWSLYAGVLLVSILSVS